MKNLIAFPDDSRVFLFGSNRKIGTEEIDRIQHEIDHFCNNWKSHGTKLNCTGAIFHNSILVFIIDESIHGASGCSQDELSRFVRWLGDTYHVDFLNRMYFHFLVEQEIHIIHKENLATAMDSGLLHADSLFYDNLVNRKYDFINHWIKPLNQSWLNNFI